VAAIAIVGIVPRVSVILVKTSKTPAPPPTTVLTNPEEIVLVDKASKEAFRDLVLPSMEDMNLSFSFEALKIFNEIITLASY